MDIRPGFGRRFSEKPFIKDPFDNYTFKRGNYLLFKAWVFFRKFEFDGILIAKIVNFTEKI